MYFLLTDGEAEPQIHPGHPVVLMLSRHFLFLSARPLPAIVRQPCQRKLTIMDFFFNH